MADNTQITAGSGTSIATDQVGSDHFQKMKLADGTADSSVMIPGTAAAGLYVDQRTNSAHTQLTFTPTISNGAAYATGDCLGGLNTVANAARTTGSGGVIRGITILDKTQAQRAAIDMLVFSASVTSAGDNNPVAFSDADMANLVGITSIVAGNYNTAWPGTPLNSVAHLPDSKTASNPLVMADPYVCAATSLFVQLVVRGTPTYTSTSDIVVILDLLRD